MSQETKAVTIIMVEDDEGHARLIEKNIRRAGVHNETSWASLTARALWLIFWVPTAQAKSTPASICWYFWISICLT